MEKKPPLLLLCTVISTKNYYIINKSPNTGVEAFYHLSNKILVQSPNFRKHFGGYTYSTRLCDFPAAAPRFCDKFQEMYFGTNPEDRVSVYGSKFKKQ